MPASPPIVGHASLLAELARDRETDNVSHAYLLAGPRHVGKMTVARRFAAELLCDGLSEEDRRAARRHIEKLTHPDILTLDQLWIEGVCDEWSVIARTSNAPQEHRAKKPAAKTDTISIDDVRSLQERLYDKAAGQYRCCIIRSVERMQAAAANAFLKILEEPPEHLVFLLTTQSFSSLLPTVVSRTRVLRLRRVSNRELLPLLSGVPDDDVQFILQIARGAPGVVCALRDDPDALRAHRQMAARARGFWEQEHPDERMRALAMLEKRGEEAEQLLLHLAIALRSRPHDPPRVAALHQLARALQTNAHRKLLVQHFALATCV